MVACRLCLARFYKKDWHNNGNCINHCNFEPFDNMDSVTYTFYRTCSFSLAFLAAPRPQEQFVVGFSTDFVGGFGDAIDGTSVK